ncbi:MAG TPA: hypothetical protein VNY73_06930 [Bacteroidia bacterium]|nr:hypothetical protein [Bacteroidia bacterium]
MENKAYTIKPLLESAEGLGKTSFKLIQFRFIDKAADVSSTLISRLLFTIAFFFFALALNIAVALWLGDLLGKNYYGFLVLAGFYGMIALILMIVHPYIKERLSNIFIKKALN